MLGPHGPRLFVGRKFTSGSSGVRGCDGCAFFGQERDRQPLIICSGKAENNAGDIVLGIRRKATCGWNCPIKKLRHEPIINPLRPTENMRPLTRDPAR
jgi:hypothetical protein